MNKRKRQLNNSVDLENEKRHLIHTNDTDDDTNDNKSTSSSIDHQKDERSDIRGDRLNISILFLLYLLQGIPLGLTGAIPMLLQNRGASYKQQAEFSFSVWPFSLKLLWAPLVDSFYSHRFGRRKSWLIPTQYLIGLFMLLLSVFIDDWLGGGGLDDNVSTGAGGATNLNSPNILFVTAIFFLLNFLAATQDIAVDGWALTMLKKCNVGHASTCNSVGQTAGYFLGYVAFIALESAEFCNSYLRTVPDDKGLVTLPGFLYFWGICFLIVTTLVAIFKHEDTKSANNQNQNHNLIEKHDDDAEPELSIAQTYKLLLNIIKLKSIRKLTGVLLTVKLTFAAVDTVSSLKLIEIGIPKDKLALLVVPLVPLQIILPLVISKFTTGPRPLDVYIKVIPYRILFGIFGTIIVWIAPFTFSSTGQVPIYYYVLLLVNYAIYQIFLYSMFVAVMSFFAKISDPAVGGTYMTLLNTVTNLGGNWPTAVVLWLVDGLTWRNCTSSPEHHQSSFEFTEHENYTQILNNICSNKIEQDSCKSFGGVCETIIDGYYLECLICVIYGIVWYQWGKKTVNQIQKMPSSVWNVVKSKAHDSR